MTNAPPMKATPSKTRGASAVTASRATVKRPIMLTLPMTTVRKAGLGTSAARTLKRSSSPNIAKIGAYAASSAVMWLVATLA